jgi:GDP-L-fucose synthase
MHLRGKRIAVTGGAGFLGKHVVRVLESRGCARLWVPRRYDYDLTTERAVERLYRDMRPDILIHLAGVSGGPADHRANPARYAYENLMMGALLMEHGRRAGLEKLVTIGSTWGYPRSSPLPLREDDLWQGPPPDCRSAFGLAKKMLLTLGQAYRQQHGFNSIHLVPATLYGPGCSFEGPSCSLVPSLIRICRDAARLNLPEVACSRDPAERHELLYVEDCAEGVVAATERFDGGEPVNLGTGTEISARDVAAAIASLTCFHGRFVWDAAPSGDPPRRALDCRRARQLFGFRARTSLQRGLRRTVHWYLEQYAPVDAAAS